MKYQIKQSIELERKKVIMTKKQALITNSIALLRYQRITFIKTNQYLPGSHLSQKQHHQDSSKSLVLLKVLLLVDKSPSNLTKPWHSQ